MFAPYSLRPATAQAIRITADNYNDVADWITANIAKGHRVDIVHPGTPNRGVPHLRFIADGRRVGVPIPGVLTAIPTTGGTIYTSYDEGDFDAQYAPTAAGTTPENRDEQCGHALPSLGGHLACTRPPHTDDRHQDGGITWEPAPDSEDAAPRSQTREHLYQTIEGYVRDIFDRHGQWRDANPDDLTARAMTTIRAGLEPRLSAAANADAIDSVRHAAEQGLPIRFDGQGPWYRLAEYNPTTSTPNGTTPKSGESAAPAPADLTQQVLADSTDQPWTDQLRDLIHGGPEDAETQPA